MKLFIERLLQVFFSIAVVAIVLGIAAGLDKLLALIHPALPAIICITFVAGMTIYFIGYFVYWMFIEPFRKGNTK